MLDKLVVKSYGYSRFLQFPWQLIIHWIIPAWQHVDSRDKNTATDLCSSKYKIIFFSTEHHVFGLVKNHPKARIVIPKEKAKFVIKVLITSEDLNSIHWNEFIDIKTTYIDKVCLSMFLMFFLLYSQHNVERNNGGGGGGVLALHLIDEVKGKSL